MTEKTPPTITDIEFSQQFDNAEIADLYKSALNFLTIQPDYALTQFRKILELFCTTIIANMDGESKDILHRIDALRQHNFIDSNFSDRLHDLRKTCNKGAHISDQKDLTEEAEKARELLVDIFGDTFVQVKCQPLPTIELSEVNDQKYKEVLFRANMSVKYQDKLEAGKLCEFMALNAINATRQDGVQQACNGDFQLNSMRFHLESLLKQAGVYYEAAYKISAANYHLGQGELFFENAHNEKKLLEYAQLEPLFRYAATLEFGVKGEENKAQGTKLLKIVADQKYAPALLKYGQYLYKIGDGNAKQYFSRAQKSGEITAYVWLGRCYLNPNLGEIDTEKTLDYYQLGAKSGCVDAMIECYYAYLNGEIVPKDMIKSARFLVQIQDSGVDVKDVLLIHQMRTMPPNENEVPSRAQQQRQKNKKNRNRKSNKARKKTKQKQRKK